MNTGRSMRASDADRERIVSLLHTAATEGRIGSDELEQRVSVALKARTYGELDALIADLPTSRTAAQRRRRPLPARVGGWAVSAVRANPWLVLLMIPALAVTFALMVTVLLMWAVVVVASTVIGGGPRHRRPPVQSWIYRHDRRLYGPAPRRTRSYWA